MKKTTLLHPARRRRGFSLIELLTVIAIIAILVSIGFYANGAIVAARNKMIDQTNLRTIYQATMAYTNDNDGFLPVGDDGTGNDADAHGVTNQRGSQRGRIWVNFIAPYIEYMEGDEDTMIDEDGEFNYAVLRSPQLEDERVQDKIAETTVDVIFGYGYNVYPRATARNGQQRGHPNAIGWGNSVWKPYSVNSISSQTTRILFANAYDWHLAGDNVWGTDFWEEDGAFVVFFDGSVSQIPQDESELFELGIFFPQRFVRGSE